MKVKELIKQLEQFDQEKDIWILYDDCLAQTPEYKIVHNDLLIQDNELNKITIKTGDYCHHAI